MQKRMEFRKIMVCSLIATIISGAAGIVSAYCGLGLWALVLYNMINGSLVCITAAFAERWLPKFEFSLQRAKILFNYGWKMFVSAVLCSLYGDIRSLVIGKKFSNNDLAYYNRGQQFPQVISHTLDSSIQSVMFPAMASVQDRTEQLVKILKRALTMGVYVIVPVMLGLAATSETVIQLLLTDKWLPCVPYMQWLCVANAAIPIVSSNLIAIKSSGRSDVYMRLETVRRLAMLLVLMVSIVCFQSVKAIAIGFCISSWLDVVITMIPVKKLLNYGVVKQFADLWRTLLASVAMFAVVQSLNMLHWNCFVLLLVQIVIGVVVYVFMGIGLKIDAQKMLIQYLTGMLKGKNTSV